MQMREYDAKDKGLEYWEMEVRNAREMAESGLELISQESHVVKLIGIKLENSTLRIIIIIFSILSYFLFLSYEANN